MYVIRIVNLSDDAVKENDKVCRTYQSFDAVSPMCHIVLMKIFHDTILQFCSIIGKGAFMAVISEIHITYSLLLR